MFSLVTATQSVSGACWRTPQRAARLAKFLCLSCVCLLLVVPAQAAPTITLANGVVNPPAPLWSTGLNPQQKAVADKATLVPVAQFSAILQSTLTAQGFSAANNWSLDTGTLTLDDNATFNITTYSLSLNGDGTKFGQTMDFTLDPNLTEPMDLPMGAVVTEHWLQVLNEDQKYGGFGYAIMGQEGFWQLDNGDVAGGAAAGAATGPYYDSNANPGDFSVPPTFHDFPRYYSGVGSYLHFTAIPVWDVFIPAMGMTPATETIYTANYGLAWGFAIVPEPSSFILLIVGIVGVLVYKRRSKA